MSLNVNNLNDLYSKQKLYSASIFRFDDFEIHALRPRTHRNARDSQHLRENESIRHTASLSPRIQPPPKQDKHSRRQTKCKNQPTKTQLQLQSEHCPQISWQRTCQQGWVINNSPIIWCDWQPLAINHNPIIITITNPYRDKIAHYTDFGSNTISFRVVGLSKNRNNI